VHGVFIDMSFAEARAKLLKQAGVKERAVGKKKVAKRTPTAEVPQRRAA
jgi:hypothetical protein